MNDYAAHSSQSSEGFTVTIQGIRVNGQPIIGHGFTRDAATLAAKRELAAHLRKSMHDFSLIVDGGR